MKPKARGWTGALTAGERGFVLRLVYSFFAAYALLFLIDCLTPVFLSLKVFVASAETLLLSSAGIAAQQYGAVVVAGSWAFKIVLECTGLVLVALLFSLLYASKLPARKIATRLLLCLPFLLAFNLARLFATLYVAILYGNAAFEAIHLLLWLADSFVVLALWALVVGPARERR